MRRSMQVQHRNGVNWATLIAAVGLGIVLVGAFWTIVQTQFSAQHSLITDNRGDIVERTRLLQEQMDRRFSALDKQIVILESTRPTTGELAATSKTLETILNRQEERIRALEQYLLGSKPPPPR